MILRARSRVVAIELVLRPLCARSIDLAAIEPGPFLGVAQEIIGRRDLLEFLLGLTIAGVEVRVQLLGESAICVLNFPGRVASLNAQDLIWVFVHRFLSKVLKAPGSCLGSIYNWFRPALVNVILSRLNSNVETRHRQTRLLNEAHLRGS